MIMEKKQYRLPREFGEKWIAALRSGRYKQGIDCLCDDKKYCCLGVAGRISGIKIDSLKDGLVLDDSVKGFQKAPLELQGTAHVNPLVDSVAKMNDNGVPFSEIADWIEANVEFYD